MQTETCFPQDYTGSISSLEDLFRMDQSGAYDAPRGYVPRGYSVVVSPHATWLEERMMSLKTRLFFDRADVVVIDVDRNPLPMFVDVACFEPVVEQALVAGQEQERLAYRLRGAFEIEPFEDGMDHPADQIIENALRSSGSQSILDWLSAFSLDTERPNFASSVLRCLGRQTHIGTAAWRAELVRNALATDDIEIRDAAVQAAESWGGLEVVNVLMLHNEPESWLQEYILEIIDDLQE